MIVPLIDKEKFVEVEHRLTEIHKRFLAGFLGWCLDIHIVAFDLLQMFQCQFCFVGGWAPPER